MAATVGIIGLGNIGFALARNLMARGHAVVGYRRSGMENFTAAGGQAASCPREVAARADFVVTSLPSGDAVTDVYEGNDGIVGAARRGLVVFELSTVPIGAKLAARKRLAAAGMVMMDGTISGNPVYFSDRTAAMFIGGDRAAFDAHAGVLRDGTDKVTWLGPFGAGRVAKFVALYLVCAHTLAAAEAFELATRCGLDRHAMFEAIQGSNATSAMLESRGALMLDRDYSAFAQDKDGKAAARAKDDPGAAPVRGMESRVRQVARLTEFATGLGGRYPLMEAMNEAYQGAIDAGIGRYDIAEIFEHLMAEGPESRDIDEVLALLARAG